MSTSTLMLAFPNEWRFLKHSAFSSLCSCLPPLYPSPAGTMSFYQNGVLKDTKKAAVRNIVSLSSMYLARPAWSNDAYAQIGLANVHVWARELNAAEIQKDMCGSRSSRDCLGLMAHIQSNGVGISDVSHASGPANPNNMYIYNSFHLQRTPTSSAFKFDGNDDWINLGPRGFGGDFGFCAWISTTGPRTWARVFDFGSKSRSTTACTAGERQRLPGANSQPSQKSSLVLLTFSGFPH